jgi:hypothetical protein
VGSQAVVPKAIRTAAPGTLWSRDDTVFQDTALRSAQTFQAASETASDDSEKHFLLLKQAGCRSPYRGDSSLTLRRAVVLSNTTSRRKPAYSLDCGG